MAGWNFLKFYKANQTFRLIQFAGSGSNPMPEHR
jgi:hypothetical protein